MSAKPLADRLFGDIALCLSGGGYRAAAYSLGALTMLNELEMLDDVKLLSTVSGGTFTGVTYAALTSEGAKFPEFYETLSNYLKKTNAIDKALDDLYDTPSPSGSTDLSVIRSAAKSYDQDLLGNRRFKQLLDYVRAKDRFRELIFNATEFRQGNAFRFRASSTPFYFIGNQKFVVPEEVAGAIYLADIVAASSCFPGAFEPIRFPDDFRFEPQKTLPDARGELLKEVHNPVTDKDYPNGFKIKDGKTGKMECVPLPLMDGGVFDNQGITSALDAEKTAGAKKFDLFLITDTSPRQEDILNTPDASLRAGGISLNTWFILAVLFFVVCVASLAIIGYSFFFPAEAGRFSSLLRGIGYVVSVAPAALLIFLLGKIYYEFTRFRTLEISGQKFLLWHYFKKMSVPDAIEIIKARVSSVLAMTSTIFLKRIRQLQFNNLMSNESRYRRVSFNLIYDLNPTDPEASRKWFKYDPKIEPTEAMKQLSKCAEDVPTTLWMSERQFQILVECGRATTCFSFIKFLWKRWEEEAREAADNHSPEPPKPNVSASPHYDVYQKLRVVFLRLKEEIKPMPELCIEKQE